MEFLLLLVRHRIVSYVVGLNYEIRPCAKAWALGAIGTKDKVKHVERV